MPIKKDLVREVLREKGIKEQDRFFNDKGVFQVMDFYGRQPSDVNFHYDDSKCVQMVEIVREVARRYSLSLRKEGRVSFSDTVEAEVPSIHIIRRTLPEAWEESLMVLMGIGMPVHTGYDPTTTGKEYEGGFTSFPSLEGSVALHIAEPDGEPQFHQGFFGGWFGFGDYLAEIAGCRDNLMIDPALVTKMIKEGKFDEIKKDTKWKYMYSQRLKAYPYLDIEAQPKTINQFNSVIDKLVKEPLSKSAQATLWDPRWDHNDGQMGVIWDHYDSPCLQRLWFRLVPFKEGYKMNTNEHFRSRCDVKGVPHNDFAIWRKFIEPVRLGVQEGLGVPVRKGRLLDQSDSLHIYGHYLDPRMQGLDAEGLLQTMFRVASGEPIEKRLVHPGTPLHSAYLEEIEKEYHATMERSQSK